jgi:hypothetical protein
VFAKNDVALQMTAQLRIPLVLLLGMAMEGQTVGEYQVKAAFLFNFTKFVEWPSASFKNPSDGIHICVIGDNPFGTLLTDAVAGKKVNDRPLVSVHVLDVKDAGRCQIIFVSKSERKNLRAILLAAESSGTLTVGDMDNFAGDGGMIGFRLEDGRVRLEINLKAAEHAQVQISSKLLSLAQIVKK